MFFPTPGPGGARANFSRLEPTPYMKLDFRVCSGTVGAPSLNIDFYELVMTPDDINIYSPESSLRGTPTEAGGFGQTQRMLYWRHDGQNLLVDIVAPQGINPLFLQLFAMHPSTVIGNPGFALTKSEGYDVSGNIINCTPA